MIRVFRGQHKVHSTFSNHTTSASSAKTRRSRTWIEEPLESVYIPVKEMLANAPGFRSLYAAREIHFEEVYADILDRAYVPIMRGPMDPDRKRLLATLRKAIEGRVAVKNEEFFLRSKEGNLEFSLVAEGIRKLALLWLLIQNGVLQEGSVLLWDEPETNLNPKVFETLIEVLLKLQRTGIQVFLATHDYVILKELDLQRTEGDEVAYHSFYRDDTGQVACHTTPNYHEIHPNAIADTFDTLYDREIERSLRVSTP